MMLRLFGIFFVLTFMAGCSAELEPETDLTESNPKQIIDKNDSHSPPEHEVPEILENNTPSEVEIDVKNNPAEIKSYDPSLVAYWSFNNNTDDEVNGFKGTIYGDVAIKQGKMGNAINLDGKSGYVELSQEALDKVGSLSEGTIAFWFKYESILDTQTVMPIFYIGNAHDNPDNMYVIEIGHSAGDGSTNNPDPNDKKIYSTWIKDNKEPFLCFDSGKNMDENTWHHYAVAVGANGNKGYINGVEIESTDHNFGDSAAQSFLDSFANKELFLLGYGRSSFMISPDFVYYKGAIDELRIYDRALTPDEVKQLYVSS